MAQLLRIWGSPPHQPDPHCLCPHCRYPSPKVLNYTDPADLAMAEKLRDCEVPFKVVGE